MPRTARRSSSTLAFDAGPQLGGKSHLLLGRDEQVPAWSYPRPGVGEGAGHSELVSKVLYEGPKALHRRAKRASVLPKGDVVARR